MKADSELYDYIMSNQVFVYQRGYTKQHEMRAIGVILFKHPTWTFRPNYQEMLQRHCQEWLAQSSDASFSNTDDMEEFDMTKKTIPPFKVYSTQVRHSINIDETKHKIESEALRIVAPKDSAEWLTMILLEATRET